MAQSFTLTFHDGTLLLDFGGTKTDPRELFQGISFKDDEREFKWRCDARYYRSILQQSAEKNIPVIDSVGDWENVEWYKSDLHSPRSDQLQAIDAWMQSNQGLIVMPTGTGKTVVALEIMKRLSVSTLVVAPVRDLMYQWHRRIQESFAYDSGIIGDNIFNVKPVSVTTYHSAYIHMNTLGARFKLIIFDECHHLPGKNRREAALFSAAPFRLGLTATPERSDGLQTDLEWLIGPTVFDMSIASVKGHVLADYDIFRIPVFLTPEEQEVYNECRSTVREFMARRNEEESGQFDWLQLIKETGQNPEARAAQQAYYKMKSIQDRAFEKFRVLEDLFKLHLGDRVMVFTGSNAMARDISSRFLVPCLLSHCGKKERTAILEGFKAHTFPVLVANQVLDEGIDIPAAKVAIVVGGQANTRQAKQRLGRILRKSGNMKGILYEVVCEDTSETSRSRQRRRSDAYKRTRHRKI